MLFKRTKYCTCYDMENLENVMQSERSQTQKGTSCRIPFNEIPRRGKFIETKSRLAVARGWGKESTWEVTV